MTARLPILASATALGLLWMVLPIGLPKPGQSTTLCVTLPDEPPDPKGADLTAVLERCVAVNPGDVELMADLGSQYESVGRFSNAEAVYRRALSVDPGYADLRLRLGRLLLQRGDRLAARREAEEALKVQPNRQALLDLERQAMATAVLPADGEPLR